MTVRLTSSLSTPAARQLLHGLVTARTHYEEPLGWPVTVNAEPRRHVKAVGEELDAVTVPFTRGQAVLAELQMTMLAGPVIADPGGGWWTFLTAPTTASQPDIAAELRAGKVHLTPRGMGDRAEPDQQWASAQWINQPLPRHSLPPWSVVIGVTRRVVEHLAITVHS